MTALRWIGERLKDLFYGPANIALDLGRVIGFATAASLIGAAGWNAFLGEPIDLMAYGTGLAAVVGAIAALVAMKDRTFRAPGE